MRTIVTPRAPITQPIQKSVQDFVEQLADAYQNGDVKEITTYLSEDISTTGQIPRWCCVVTMNSGKQLSYSVERH